MVLAFPNIAFHPAAGADAGNRLVAELPDVEEALAGVDQVGEPRALAAAVDMLDLDRAADHAIQGVEHDEAGPVGGEVAGRPRDQAVGDGAVGLAQDVAAPGQLAGTVAA